MKRTLHLFVAVIIFCSSAKSATITWDGGAGDGLWSTAANWVGDIVPVAGDDVVLDNSFVAGTYNVFLPAGNISVSINSLTITPSGIIVITFRVPITNTSTTAFTATGAGDAVVLNSGAIFINSSGAPNGTPVSVTGTNFFRINNGGKYVHNTPRGHTTNLVSRLSKVTGTEFGIFEFDIPDISTTISLSGRTFGTLVLSSTAFGAPLTYSGNGAMPLLIQGNFQINADVTFSIGMSADFTVNGNYSQAGSSAFSLQNSTDNNIVKLKGNIISQGLITETGTGLPVLEINGTVNQDVNITGSITNSVTLQMNNTTGATLSASLILPYKLNLVSGKIKTSTTKILSLLDNATVTGGSSNSFVEGPMKKVGDDPFFTFPIGKGSIYAPISFNSIGLALTNEFMAEYHRANPQNLYGTNYESPFDHISYVEYWSLEKTVGSLSVPVNVTLSITPYSFARVMNTTYITKYNSGDLEWKDVGTLSRTDGIPVPPTITGSVESNPLTELGIFTLATTDPFETNPLPVKLISFNAIKAGNGTVNLNWQLSENAHEEIQFEIQRSENRKDFKTISSLYAMNHIFYSTRDNNLKLIDTWYRLKITDKAGNVFYSKTIFISNRNNQFYITSVFPNPAREDITVSINSIVQSKISIIIYNGAGKEVRKINTAVNKGINLLKLETGSFTNGVYFICISNPTGRNILRFVKL